MINEVNAVSSDDRGGDLAYLRQLATAGQDTPLMAGPYLVVGGGWFAAASLVQWVVVRDLLGLTHQPAILAWLLAAVGFAISLVFLVRRDRAKVESSRNLAINSVWTGIGYSIFAFWLGVTIMAYLHDNYFVLNSISLYVLGAYGIGWTLAAAVTGRAWMHVVAIFTFLTVPVLGALVGTGQEYLAYALALVFTAVIPGVRLMRESAATKPAASV